MIISTRRQRKKYGCETLREKIAETTVKVKLMLLGDGCEKGARGKMYLE